MGRRDEAEMHGQTPLLYVRQQGWALVGTYKQHSFKWVSRKYRLGLPAYNTLALYHRTEGNKQRNNVYESFSYVHK